MSAAVQLSSQINAAQRGVGREYSGREAAWIESLLDFRPQGFACLLSLDSSVSLLVTVVLPWIVVLIALLIKATGYLATDAVTLSATISSMLLDLLYLRKSAARGSSHDQSSGLLTLAA